MLSTLAKSGFVATIMAATQPSSYYDLDIGAVEAAVKERVSKELEQMSLANQIKKTVNEQVRALMQEQDSLEQKWNELRNQEAKLWDEYRGLTLQQKLNMVLEDLSEATALDELWADSGVDATTLDESFANVRMTFNTEAGTVNVVSELQNAKDMPMFEWTMTPATGEIVEVSRDRDGHSEKTINKDVDPAELTSHTAIAANTAVQSSYGGSLNKLLEDPSVLQLEWDEAEAQRDIAFKIMYFFIALVIVTFLTLYAYFTIVQKSEQQARVRALRKKQGIMDDDVTAAPLESASFTDFLTGSFDADEALYSRPTPRVLHPAVKSTLSTAGQAVAIGLGMGTSVFYAQTQKKTAAAEKNPSAEMKDTGFGSSNLTNLEQRGAYSGAEVDHFEFDGDHPDTELLAKLADKAQ